MSIHANQPIKSGPSAPGRKNIMGHNSTYLSEVQRSARSNKSKDADRERETAKPGTRKTGKPQNPVAVTKEKGKAPGFGDGHYTPAK